MPGLTLLAFAETVQHDVINKNVDENSGIMPAALFNNDNDDILQHFPPLPSLKPTLRDIHNDWEFIERDSHEHNEEETLPCDSDSDSGSTLWVGRRTYAEAAICGGVHHEPIHTEIFIPSAKITATQETCGTRINDTTCARNSEIGQHDFSLYDYVYDSNNTTATGDNNDPYYQIKSVKSRKLHNSERTDHRQQKVLEIAFRHHTHTYQKQQQHRENKQLLYYETALKTTQEYLKTCKAIGERLPPRYYFTGRDRKKRAHFIRLTHDGILHVFDIYPKHGPINKAMQLKQIEQELADPCVREILYDLLEGVVGKAAVPWAWSGHMDDASIKSRVGTEVNYINFYYISIYIRLHRSLIPRLETEAIPDLIACCHKERRKRFRKFVDILPSLSPKSKSLCSMTRMQYARYILGE